MTQPPAANRIAGWNWLFRAKSSASKSASRWRSDDSPPWGQGPVSGGTLVDAGRGRRRSACRMAIRRGSRLDKHLLYFRRISVALAGLVRARHQFANRRVQPEPQGAGEI